MAGIWASSARARPASPPRRATSRAAWATRRRASTWPRPRPSPPRPWPAASRTPRAPRSAPMITGHVWKFGDDINTDLMLPGPLLTASEEEQRRAVFSANRPGWVSEITPGDIIIGGRNFGTGSSRPAARSLRNLGLGALIAESINGL